MVVIGSSREDASRRHFTPRGGGGEADGVGLHVDRDLTQAVMVVCFDDNLPTAIRTPGLNPESLHEQRGQTVTVRTSAGSCGACGFSCAEGCESNATRRPPMFTRDFQVNVIG